MRPPAPDITKLGLGLAWVHIVFVAISMLLIQASTSLPLIVTVVQILSAAVTVIFTLLLGRGFGWVRFAWTALVLLSIPSIPKSMSLWFSDSWLMGALYLVGTASLWAALGLLFVPASKAWFRVMKVARSTSPIVGSSAQNV